MAVIFALSSQSNPLPDARLSFSAHGIAYAILGALLVRALWGRDGSLRTIAIAVVCASLYGASDEVHQAFVPGRVPDVLDWSTDTIGALLGAVAAFRVLALLARRSRDAPTD
jgi:VanZ family protein